MMTFQEELEKLINRHSMENGSNTHDFILAEYLKGCLLGFDRAVIARDRQMPHPPEAITTRSHDKGRNTTVTELETQKLKTKRYLAAEREMRIFITGYDIAEAKRSGACEEALAWLEKTRPVRYLDLFYHNLTWFLWAVDNYLVPLNIAMAAARVLSFHATEILRMR
jgi:hypothetical protein